MKIRETKNYQKFQAYNLNRSVRKIDGLMVTLTTLHYGGLKNWLWHEAVLCRPWPNG